MSQSPQHSPVIGVAAAGPSDLPEITAIYNEAVADSVATFHVEPRTEEQQREWFESRGRRHPVIVARRQGLIVGWASLSEFSDRRAYENTAEDSVYVAEEWRGKGIGRQLLGRLVELAAELGHHSILARIADHSAVSIALHRSAGFREVGVLHEVGRKFDRWIDVTLMERVLDQRLTERRGNASDS